MTLPEDYLERVYAGVLGKIIGVYLGRPFEGWTYEAIIKKLGVIQYYVHDKLGLPLIVTDDDISGTFTFIRALADHGYDPAITAEQIGKTWLNYLIEKKTILWWGGLGNSTEHTAYLRLKNGIPAPKSGSIEANGPIVAQQIGAQIFIDGWAMVNPGDPERAARMAGQAASVSHDGEAIYGAQVLVGMEAQAFVESDIDHLIDTGVGLIPADSIIYRMIADLRDWHIKDGDWRKTYQRIAGRYGYHDYIGGCHMVPNHALIILGLLYGEGDFQKAMSVVNTSGWDTDCNSGNLGCLMGLRNGLAGFEDVPGVDWRGPVADRMYLPTADGGGCVTDAVTQAYAITNLGRMVAGEKLLAPKNGARFHFELPGSLQGLQADRSPDCSPYVKLSNVAGHSHAGRRSLCVAFTGVGKEIMARVRAPTFITPEDMVMPGYELIASPTLYPGQMIHMGISTDEENQGPLKVQPYIDYYTAQDQPARHLGPTVNINQGSYQEINWLTPDPQSQQPAGSLIFAVGLQVSRPELVKNNLTDKVYIDFIGWDGSPELTFKRPDGAVTGGDKKGLWQAYWVNAVDQWERWGAAYRLIQNEGRGMISTGTRQWKDISVSSRITPALSKDCGVAARVQGLTRFYALELVEGGKARLIKAYEGQDSVLSEVAFPWELWHPYHLRLEVKGSHLNGWLDDHLLLTSEDSALESGGIALVISEGHLMTDEVKVKG